MSDFEDMKTALAFAGRLADAAREAILPHFRNLDAVEGKPGAVFDPVTEADKAAERAMRTIIEEERPEDGITGEEYGEKPSQNGWTWLLDPIDGTRSFVAGLPLWVTLIGYVNADNQPILGLIDQPVLDERYLGWPGGAALEQGGQRTPITVSDCEDLREATVSTTDPFILNMPEQGAWNHIRGAARLVRYGLDAYAYARLAGGTIDLIAESELCSWDAAALIPVVRGAGGLATTWSGAPADASGGQLVCASSQEVLDQALIALRRSATLG